MEKNLEDIKHIRSMMERSSKFLSLSGLSGISAGCIALVGAWVAYLILEGKFTLTNSLLYDLVIVAVLIVVGASLFGIYFSSRKARKNNSTLWQPVTKQIFIDLSIPMAIGGIICLIFIYKDLSYLIAPFMLIFYGISLIHAGARTYKDVKKLGICEILLGLVALVVDEYSLLFWAIGFGVLHIVYGIVMYYKYDVKSAKEN